MPKRSNDFQKLIYLIENVLNDGNAKVIQSAEVVDNDTGNIREVDILIESIIGTHNVKIGIECVSKSRSADVKWIEEMSRKHESLGTNKLILVSKSGFTKSAKIKASKQNIEIYTLEDAEKIDWKAKVHKIPRITLCNFLIKGKNVIVVPLYKKNDSEKKDEDLDKAIIFNNEGENLGSIMSYSDVIINEFLNSYQIRDEMENGYDYELSFGKRFHIPCYILDKHNNKIEIQMLKIVLTIEKIISEMKLEKQFYGNTPVTYANTEFMGNKLNVTFIQKPDETIYFTGGIEKSKKS